MRMADIKDYIEQLKSGNVPNRIGFINRKDTIERGEDRVAAFTELVQELSQVSDIKDVDIEQGALAPEEISKLFDALAKSDNVKKRLTIWNQIPRQNIPMLAEYIKNSKNLKELDIGDNSKGEISIDDASLAELAKGIAQNHSLEWLMLDEVTGSPQFYTALSEILHNNKTLKRLYIWNCTLRDSGIAAMTEALQNNTTLKELDVHRANLGNGGATVLVKCLENNKALTSLGLDYNDLTQGYKQEDVQAIARLLKNNTVIAGLSLDTCNLGDMGAAIIGEALQYNKGLNYISLENNRIRDRGIIAIAQGLEQNNTLCSLDIESDAFDRRDGSSTPNHIGPSGAKAIRKLLEVNHTLHSLYMNYSYSQNSWEISPVMAEIAAGLKNNRTLSNFRIVDGYRPKKLYLSFTDAKILAEAIIASGNKNLSYCGSFRPNMDSLDSPDPKAVENLNKIHDYCEQIWNIARALLAKIREHPEELTLGDLQECKERMNAILSWGGQAEIQTILSKREEEIRRQTALQRRRKTNDRVIHDLSNYAEDNGLTFEQMCSEIALYRTDNFS